MAKRIRAAADRRDNPALLTQTTRGTPMGDLLRQFWQPVALSAEVTPGKAARARVYGEDLTLYRGESGKAYLIAGNCAHRCTRLHTGWVEGEAVRCVYHGWKYDGTGQCIEMPAEKASLPATVKVAGYPTHEYCGLVFAFMGTGPVPDFDLPRKDVFESPDRQIFTREQIWPANFFQQVENSLDAAHVSFVHQKGKIGIFGRSVTPAVPKLEYLETDAGIRQIATRSAGNVRVSDWTFPNNNHILVPGISTDHPWMDIAVWLVPIDDTSTSRFQLYAPPRENPEKDRRTGEHFAKHMGYYPTEHESELMDDHIYPTEMALELVNAQDYVAVVGQGAIADRVNERLTSSDAGIALLRRIFYREMAALRDGQPTKSWKRLHEEIVLQSEEATRAGTA